MELMELKHIKPRQIKILQEAGIESLEALAMSAPQDLQLIDGISEKASKNLVWAARDSMNLTAFKNVAEMEENYEYITTGSKNLDEILGGGISTGRITEVFGAFKSGKTNLSHTVCVTVQLPKEKGGLNGAALFIDTENTFSKKKIERIARRFGDFSGRSLKNIYHARIFSTDHQLQMVRVAEKAIQEKNAKLIVIDSLMAMMRSEYIGIGMLAARQQILNKLIHDLSRIAETYNVAVLVTNQVATVMKGTFASNDAIGGNIVAHGCHFRMMFKTSGFSANSSLERTAVIVDAPDLPPNSTKFYITEAGIADTETIKYPEELTDEDNLFNLNASADIILQSADELTEDNEIDPLVALEEKLNKKTEKKSSIKKSSSKAKKTTTKKTKTVKKSTKKKK